MRWKDILKHEWKIRPCWSGKDCWCRKICTKSGTIVVDGTILEKQLASYFVALHNKKIRNHHGKIHNISVDFYNDFDDLITENLMDMKWKAVGCGVRGHKCRTIRTIEENTITSGLGFLQSPEAEYFAKLHNNFLMEQKKK